MISKETIKRVGEHVKKLNLYRSRTELIAVYGGKVWSLSLCRGKSDLYIYVLIGVSESGCDDTVIVSPSEKVFRAVKSGMFRY